MSQPTPYDRLHNLTEYATANPSAPFNPAYADDEFNAIVATLYQTLVNLTLIQRDDGALKNGVVTPDSLSAAVLAIMVTAGASVRGAWLTTTAYALKDVVTQSGATYICATAHTSGTFATDLAAGKWVAIYSGSTVAASAVTFSPTGSVAATTVQTAISEVDSEKLAKASNLSDVASRATAFDNLVAPGGTMTAALNFNGGALNTGRGADIPSAATINLDAATGNDINITGTTDISTMTLTTGSRRLRFTGVLKIVGSGTLVTPGGGSIVTQPGDVCEVISLGGGIVQLSDYLPATGQGMVAFPWQPLSAGVAGNALTVTLAAGARLVFSDGSAITTSAAITLTVSSGSTLGTTNGVAARLWVVAMKNGGTPELAIINTLSGTNIYRVQPTDTITTTAEGGLGAADSAQVWYSTTLRANQFIAVVGYVEVTEATAGTYATAPSLTQGFGPGCPLPGDRVQIVGNTDGAMATGATALPNDDTIPQSGEGNQFMSQAITPRSAINILNCRHVGNYAVAGSAVGSICALFQDATAGALAAVANTGGPGGASQYNQFVLDHSFRAGVVVSTTLKIRVGNAGGTTTTFNGQVGARTMGGVMASRLSIEELMA